MMVAALDQQSTRRVMQLLRNPPHDGKYAELKKLLLRRYSLTSWTIFCHCSAQMTAVFCSRTCSFDCSRLRCAPLWPTLRASSPAIIAVWRKRSIGSCWLLDVSQCSFHPRTAQQCAMFLPPAFRQQGSALHFSVHIRSVGKRRRRHAVAAVGPGEQEELLFIKGSLSGRVSWWTLVRRRASLRLHIKS